MNVTVCVSIILLLLVSMALYFELQQKSENNIPIMSQVPTLSNKYNKYPRYPKYNGSYDQCTNNCISNPNKNNCPCENSSFKISDKFYNQYMNKVINIDNDIKVDDENPRVNIWKGDIKNDNFFVQCS